MLGGGRIKKNRFKVYLGIPYWEIVDCRRLQSVCFLEPIGLWEKFGTGCLYFFKKSYNDACSVHNEFDMVECEQ